MSTSPIRCRQPRAVKKMSAMLNPDEDVPRQSYNRVKGWGCMLFTSGGNSVGSTGVIRGLEHVCAKG